MPSMVQTLPEIANQVLVQIEIAGGKIHVYPEEPPTVYYVWDPAHATPGRPTEVRWVVRGLEPRQFVRILEKTGNHGAFESPRFEIPPGYNSVTSGQPRLRPSPPSDHLHWYYGIQVVEKVQGGGEKIIAELDPDVIIKEDP